MRENNSLFCSALSSYIYAIENSTTNFIIISDFQGLVRGCTFKLVYMGFFGVVILGIVIFRMVIVCQMYRAYFWGEIHMGWEVFSRILVLCLGLLKHLWWCFFSKIVNSFKLGLISSNYAAGFHCIYFRNELISFEYNLLPWKYFSLSQMANWN